MSKRIIKVLWADDEAVYEDRFIQWNKNNQYQIDLLDGVRDAEELEKKLIEYEGLVDAVIVDANFADKGMPESERTGSGLSKSNELKAKYGKDGKKIPFFLYTGRDDETLERIFGSSGVLDYYIKSNHKFSKLAADAVYQLFDRIYQVVEAHNTIEFQLRNLYPEEFEAAKMVGAERLLLKGLMFDYSDDWNDVQEYFTPLRKIFEQITDCCVEKKILPFVNSIEGYSHLLNMESCLGFTLKAQIMENTLCHMLDYFLSITQDGSHKKNSSELKVDAYVKSTKNTNLFKSVLYVAMDLLIWYKRIIMEGNLTKNNWTGCYLHEGIIDKKIVKLNNGKEIPIYYSGQYQLEPPKGDLLKKGAKVVVLNSIPNSHPDGQINQFVFLGNYHIDN